MEKIRNRRRVRRCGPVPTALILALCCVTPAQGELRDSRFLTDIPLGVTTPPTPALLGATATQLEEEVAACRIAETDPRNCALLLAYRALTLSVVGTSDRAAADGLAALALYRAIPDADPRKHQDRMVGMLAILAARFAQNGQQQLSDRLIAELRAVKSALGNRILLSESAIAQLEASCFVVQQRWPEAEAAVRRWIDITRPGPDRDLLPVPDDHIHALFALPRLLEAQGRAADAGAALTTAMRVGLRGNPGSDATLIATYLSAEVAAQAPGGGALARTLNRRAATGLFSLLQMEARLRRRATLDDGLRTRWNASGVPLFRQSVRIAWQLAHRRPPPASD